MNHKNCLGCVVGINFSRVKTLKHLSDIYPFGDIECNISSPTKQMVNVKVINCNERLI